MDANAPGCSTQDRHSFAESCITCGDVAVQVTIKRLLPASMALVRTAGGDEQVSVALVQAAAGDVVLVHAGEAIAVLGR